MASTPKRRAKWHHTGQIEGTRDLGVDGSSGHLQSLLAMVETLKCARVDLLYQDSDARLRDELVAAE